MRLFTALWPPAEVVAALERALEHARPELPARWRRTPSQRWHVTLAFHGQDDPAARAGDLEDRLRGAQAPTLRIAGTGTFPGVLWAGVQTDGRDGDAALRALVAGAGGDPDAFVAHLTLARSSRRVRPALPSPAPGPWWTPGEVLLVASERVGGEVRYRAVHHVPLRPPG